jgi:predicted ATP-grasp superfamily ATP-dependent carboligase
MQPPPDAGRGVVAVAGLSARLMAESARRAGYEAIALDAFGDRDTRQAAVAWHGIGTGQGVRLEGARVLAVLGELRRQQPGLVGWIAGAGFEALPAVLAQGAGLLPLLGTPPPAQASLRHPGTFFGVLAELGLPHPATRLQRPDRPAGWLLKDFGGSGGWQVRPASAAPPSPPGLAYYQQRMPGEPMSCLFIGNGREARVLGHQHQAVAALGNRPCVWHGVLGPVEVPAAARAVTERAVHALVPRFGLRGLASLDYLLEGDAVHLLECNPRPSASMALYEGDGAPSLIDAHVRACLHGTLPDPRTPAGRVHGTHLVFARRVLRLDGDGLARLQHSGWCHDLAAAAVAIGRHEPVCTVSAEAQDLAALRGLLAARVQQVHGWLEPASPAARRAGPRLTETLP